MEVNFRKLVPYHSGIDRVTHLMHSYPAKLLLNIPLFFLRCEQMGAVGHLRDPFCGSGTVLLEGALKGWQVSGADSNPLARLVTKAKLTFVDLDEIMDASKRICTKWKERQGAFTPVVDVDYWFTKEAQSQLGGLLAGIQCETNDELRRFLLACLSSCIRKASLADPRLSVPVRIKPDSDRWGRTQESDAIALFRKVVEENARRVQCLSAVDEHIARSLSISTDARNTDDGGPDAGEVDLIITSPPYVGAQKYIRASSLSIGWLNLAPESRLPPLEADSIGREHYRKEEYEEAVFPEFGTSRSTLVGIRTVNPLRSHIAATYLIEMREALQEMQRLLRPDGKLLMVLGNNTITGKEFLTSRYLMEIASSLGFHLDLELVDDIRSRGLMTKRNRTAGIISREYVQMYSKQ